MQTLFPMSTSLQFTSTQLPAPKLEKSEDNSRGTGEVDRLCSLIRATQSETHVKSDRDGEPPDTKHILPQPPIPWSTHVLPSNLVIPLQVIKQERDPHRQGLSAALMPLADPAKFGLKPYLDSTSDLTLSTPHTTSSIGSLPGPFTNPILTSATTSQLMGMINHPAHHGGFMMPFTMPGITLNDYIKPEPKISPRERRDQMKIGLLPTPGSRCGMSMMSHAAPSSVSSFISQMNGSVEPKLPDIKINGDSARMSHSETGTVSLSVAMSAGGMKPIELSPMEPDQSSSASETLSSSSKTKATTSEDRQHECPFCQKRFSYKGNMVVHIRTHTGEKRYQCTHCMKRFSKRQNLQSHVRTHTGERPYKCDQCGREFSRQNNLSRHKRIHSNVKPFQCSVCGKKFCSKSNLKSHMVIHGERTIQKCHYCQKCFKSGNYFKKHVQKHESDEVTLKNDAEGKPQMASFSLPSSASSASSASSSIFHSPFFDEQKPLPDPPVSYASSSALTTSSSTVLTPGVSLEAKSHETPSSLRPQIKTEPFSEPSKDVSIPMPHSIPSLISALNGAIEHAPDGMYHQFRLQEDGEISEGLFPCMN